MGSRGVLKAVCTFQNKTRTLLNESRTLLKFFRRLLPALKKASHNDENGIFWVEKRHFSGVFRAQKAGRKRLNFVSYWE